MRTPQTPPETSQAACTGTPATSVRGPQTRGQTRGWGVSLHFRGRSLVERSVRDGGPVRIGEDPACALVVPGLGDASTLALADRLYALPGLTGVVHRAADSEHAEPLDRELTLAPGDRAALRFVDHPEITLELRREDLPRLPLSSIINFRELGQQLVIGAGLVAGLVLLVRHEMPVNTLEVKGDPDADEDSALVRAMFAVEVPPIELRYRELWAPIPRPVIVEPMPPAPVAEAPPVPLLAVPEAVAVPPAPVDAPPGKRRKRPRNPEIGEVVLLGSLSASEYDSVFVDGGVPGGVVGGVVGGTIGQDLLAELKTDAPLLAEAGQGVSILTDKAVAAIDPTDVIAEKVAEPVLEEVLEERVDFVENIENIMGPGVDDLPAAPVMPGGPEVLDPSPVPKDMPSAPGVQSHTKVGEAQVARGVADGLAAVAPEARCEDPGVARQRQLDVVFVVDVSTTMTFMLERIEKQIAKVDAEARAQGLDTRYGLVVFVDDVKLGNAGKPYADLRALQAELATWRAFTAGNRQINSPDLNLDWPENTLDAVHAAATDFAWRPADTTLRMIVHATDDDFGEAPAIQSGQTVKHSYADTVAALRSAQVRMFSFAAKVGGQCECLDVRPGLYTRFHGRPSLPDATGGAVFDIDEVASGKLGFAAAVGGAIKAGVCTRYPLSPFGDLQ